MIEKIVGLPPVITNESEVLILGSMPSVRSLEQHEYYGNPRNHFWNLIYGIFQEVPSDSYEEKISFIKEKHIALWDTIGSCYREGSLDSNIRDEEPNDIPQLLVEFPTIKLLACNGTKSYNTLKKYCKPEILKGVSVIKLPSSSPVPGRFNKSLEEKMGVWKQILQYL
ncbi:DNA-deoxyinosine glycosylase [Ornithinibacillus scapharcae]|uniref:DNA-deoxyinosine glycosylase n=1 Tax=Ornithinibacillus scapharcae TaxID=1147159 RepID=UPI000225AD4E|nr:DNA-deoxyinosine glycosylase [Ornithinibacillus scapharcae]